MVNRKQLSAKIHNIRSRSLKLYITIPDIENPPTAMRFWYPAIPLQVPPKAAGSRSYDEENKISYFKTEEIVL